MPDTKPKIKTIQEYEPIGRPRDQLRIRVLTTEEMWFDVREYLLDGNSVGFTRRGIKIKSRGDLLKLKHAVDDALFMFFKE